MRRRRHVQAPLGSDDDDAVVGHVGVELHLASPSVGGVAARSSPVIGSISGPSRRTTSAVMSSLIRRALANRVISSIDLLRGIGTAGQDRRRIEHLERRREEVEDAIADAEQGVAWIQLHHVLTPGVVGQDADRNIGRQQPPGEAVDTDDGAQPVAGVDVAQGAGRDLQPSREQRDERRGLLQIRFHPSRRVRDGVGDEQRPPPFDVARPTAGARSVVRRTARTDAAMRAAPRPLPITSAIVNWNSSPTGNQSKKSPPTSDAGMQHPATSKPGIDGGCVGKQTRAARPRRAPAPPGV